MSSKETAQTPQTCKKETKGRLIRLRTRDEVHVSNKTIDVYIIEIPAKLVNSIRGFLKPIIPPDNPQTPNLQHLRRVCNPNFLPEQLGSPSSLGPATNPEIQTVHFLICPASKISISELSATLANAPPALLEPLTLPIRKIPVPAYAPISAEQAATWSARFWPTMFKNTNPHGAHPAIVSRAEAELLSSNGGAGSPGVDVFMRLAADVGREGLTAGIGVGTGAVAVERTSRGAQIVAVASDARWCGILDGTREGGGNPLGHAAMRVVGLVAQRRLLQSSTSCRAAAETATPPPGSFLDLPLTRLESTHLASSTLTPNGYLCLDLELYITHEPCVMCSMAILHSRFGRVVFGQEMPATGALMAEREARGEGRGGGQVESENNGKEDLSGLRYGLLWRGELNWKALCWMWRLDREDGLGEYAYDYDENLGLQRGSLDGSGKEEDGIVELDAKTQV